MVWSTWVAGLPALNVDPDVSTRTAVNRRRGHSVADVVVPDGPMPGEGLPARHG
jgi:hypothetical protein